MASLKRMKEGLIQEDSDEFLGLWDSVLNVEHVGVEVAFLYFDPLSFEDPAQAHDRSTRPIRGREENDLRDHARIYRLGISAKLPIHHVRIGRAA